MDISLIPETAWVQAVFVCLFIVMVVYMTERHGKFQREWQSYMSDENEKWQQFMAEQDECVSASLEKIRESLQKMNECLISHDLKVDQRISEASEKSRRDTARAIERQSKKGE